MDNKAIVYTVKDVQELLGIGRRAAYNLFNQEDFPSVTVGNTKRVLKEDFQEWLNGQKRGQASA